MISVKSNMLKILQYFQMMGSDCAQIYWVMVALIIFIKKYFSTLLDSDGFWW